MSTHREKAFTIIELVVVISVIVVLIAILLPAVGKARDKARTSTSQSNLRQLAIAHRSYAADWEGRQLTLVRDQISAYGSNVGDYHEAMGYFETVDDPHLHPGPIAGWAEGNLWAYYQDGGGVYWWAIEAIGFPGGEGIDGFGWFRLANCKQLSQYLNGRWYDKAYFAPKDPVWELVEHCLDQPGEFAPREGCNSPPKWTTYCLSPAALLDPVVLSYNKNTDAWFTDPWIVAGGHRVPAMSQIEFPALKTHMLEHPWLQNVRTICNPSFASAFADACEPYYFNMGWESAPATLLYDGSVRLMGVQEALDANRRYLSQTDDQVGLWNDQTPFGGSYDPGGLGGYFSDYAYDWTSTSYHILTTAGARGRDTLGKQ